MDKALWQKLQPLIDKALDLSSAERAEWIDRVRKDSPTIAEELERLLAQEGTLDRHGFLDTPSEMDVLMERAIAAEATGFQRAQLQMALASRYTLDRELGRGGMATVFHARDVRHQRDVAIKVIRPDAASAVGAERFLAEIRLTANLTHPNILPLLDSGSVDGVLFYVMPYIAGESLRARMRREGPLPIDDAVRILRTVTEALAHAHGKGAVHRDIKPDNILLDGRQAWVADFGIAKAIASSATGNHAATSAGVTLGSPRYMSPEQIEGVGLVDHRADLYSLGAMAWEMLAGRPVFGGTSMQQLFMQHLTAIPSAISSVRADVPPALADAVMKCLAKSRDERWESAHALLDALEAAYSTSGVHPPPGRGGPPAIRLVAFGVLAAAAAGGSWWIAGRKDHAPVRITSAGDAVQPHGSPDGRWIAFRRLGSLGDVWVQRADSSQPTRVVSQAPGLFGWMNDSTVAVAAPGGALRAIHVPDGRDMPLPFAAGATGAWQFAGPGQVYLAAVDSKDSARWAVRRATVSGWSDSLRFHRDPGERVAWLAATRTSSTLAIGSVLPDSSVQLGLVSPGREREISHVVPVGAPAGLNRYLRRFPLIGRDLRYVDFWIGGRDSVVRVDLKTRGRVPERVPLGSFGVIPFELTPRGDILGTIGELTVHTWRFSISGDTGKPVKEIETSRGWLQSLSASADGLWLFRAEGRSITTLVLQNVVTAQRRSLVTFAGTIDAPRWSPDGIHIAMRVNAPGKSARWMVVDTRDGGMMPLGREPLTKLGATSFSEFSPAWSPDGRHLFTTDLDSEPRPRARRFDLVAGDTGKVISSWWDRVGGEMPHGIVVSPDGRSLAVGGTNLMRIDVEGGGARELVKSDSISLIIPISWSEDGQVVFATRDTRRHGVGGMSEFHVVPVSGGPVRQLGALPTKCNSNFSALRGGREAACYESEAVTDAWLVARPRR